MTAVAAVHTVAAVVFHGGVMHAVIRAGGWNTLDAQGADEGRSLAFWFLMAGLILGLTGALVDWIEVREDGRLPPFTAWWLLAIAAVGIFLVPTLAFWLLLPPGVASAWRSRRGR